MPGPLAEATVHVTVDVGDVAGDLDRKVTRAAKKAAKQVEKDLDAVGDAAENAGKKAKLGLGRTVKQLDEVKQNAQLAADFVATLETEIRGFQPLDLEPEKFREAHVNAAGLVAEMRDLEDQIDRAGRALDGVDGSSLEEVTVAAKYAGEAIKYELADDIEEGVDKGADAAERRMDVAGVKLRRKAKKAGEDSGKGFGNSFRDQVRKALSFDIAERVLAGVTAPLRASFAGLGLSVVAAGGASAAASLVQLAAALAPVVGLMGALPAAGALAAAGIGTLVVAFHGMGDALGAAFGTDGKKYAEAIKNLAPAARSVVKEIRGFAPVIRKVGRDIQQEFFLPLQGDFTDLFDHLAGPMRKGMMLVAEALGNATHQVAVFGQESKTVAAVAVAFTTVRSMVQQITPAIRPVLAGFRELALALYPKLQGLAGTIRDLGTRFGQWMQHFADSGAAVQAWDDAISVLRRLGMIAGDVAGIVRSIGTAATVAGGDALNSLALILDRINQALSSAEGQAALVAVFRALSQVGDALEPILVAVLQGLGGIAPVVAEVATALGPALTTVIEGLGSALQQMGPGLEQLASGLADGLVALGPALGPLGAALGGILSAVSPLLPLLGDLAAQFAGVLASVLNALSPVLRQVTETFAAALAPVLPVLAQAFIDLAAALAPVAEQLADAFLVTIQELAPYLPDLVEALAQTALSFADILTQLAPLLPGLMQLAFEIFTRPTLELVLLIAQAVGWMATKLADLAEKIPIDDLQQFIDKLGGAASKAGAALAPVQSLADMLSGLKDAFGTARAAVRDWSTDTNAKINGALTRARQSITSWSTSWNGKINSALSTARASIRSWSTDWNARISSGLSRAHTSIRTWSTNANASINAGLGRMRAAISSWSRDWNARISRGISSAVTTVRGFPGRASSALGSLASRVGGVATRAFDRLRSAASSGISRALSTLRGLPGRAASAVGNLSGTLWSAGSRLIGGFIDGIQSRIGDVTAKLRHLTSLIPKVKGPPERDAKLLRGAGQLIIDGLIAGLEDRFPLVARTLGRLSTSMAGMVEAPALAGPTLGPPARLTANGSALSLVRPRPPAASTSTGGAGRTVEVNAPINVYPQHLDTVSSLALLEERILAKVRAA